MLTDKRNRSRIYLVLEDTPEDVSRWKWALIELAQHPVMAGKVFAGVLGWFLSGLAALRKKEHAENEQYWVEREKENAAKDLSEIVNEALEGKGS